MYVNKYYSIVIVYEHVLYGITCVSYQHISYGTNVSFNQLHISYEKYSGISMWTMFKHTVSCLFKSL